MQLINNGILASSGSTSSFVGRIFYVDDVNGLDSRTTSQAQNIGTPWKTIGKLNGVLIAGDTAYVRSGTYRSSAGNSASIHF